MKHELAHFLIADEQRGRLAPEKRDELRAHLETCVECRREEAAEAALTDALERLLPQRAAPLALKRRLAARVSSSARVAAPLRRRMTNAVIYTAASLVVLAALVALFLRGARVDSLAEARLRDEAVNDHLRVLDGDEPLAIVSSGIHEVKPWFAGKLDFAPALAFAGSDDFPLRGGAVSHFLDRKAATFVYGRRLHTISLFVFRADGLAWPTGDLTTMGRVNARVAADRGFSTVVWRDGELGYALVSDVDVRELLTLGGLIVGGS